MVPTATRGVYPLEEPDTVVKSVHVVCLGGKWTRLMSLQEMQGGGRDVTMNCGGKTIQKRFSLLTTLIIWQ